MNFSRSSLSIFIFVMFFISCQNEDIIKDNYVKREAYIPMRDGAKMYTAIYSPRDSSVSYPLMIVKTPYNNQPYGEKDYAEKIGPSHYLEKEKFIFVHMDARGSFMSEGKWNEMTPHLINKQDSLDIDESSDTYDAVEWLLKNTNNNGNVGLWGISYRGFYVSAGIIDAHPAIKCASPQAPIADWFIGDDMHHHGAFSLLPSFAFFEAVGLINDSLYQDWPELKPFPIRDAYNFLLEAGKADSLDELYFGGSSEFWDSIVNHPDYDIFWQRRNILPHLKNIEPDVLVTAGLFDHENLYGSMKTYHAIQQNSDNSTRLVLGPWIHGGWARTTGEHLGDLSFGMTTSDYYQKYIEMPFFNYYLKQKGTIEDISNVSVFVTGSNTWRYFDQWPPAGVQKQKFYLSENNYLTSEIPVQTDTLFEEYISDPQNPVPYTQLFHPVRLFYNKEYMCEDQRFADSRPDVISYGTNVLEDSVTIAGPVLAKIFASSSGTDFDLVVKLIDVYPDETDTEYYKTPVTEMAGYQQLVRAEIIRAKYRNSYENPKPITPGEIEEINIELNDVSHTFLPGHKIMIQIQSSWFPLYDRNPHKFMNIYKAEESDYQKATIRIYHSKDFPSEIEFNSLTL